jgi:predicted transcriptional regulator
MGIKKIVDKLIKIQDRKGFFRLQDVEAVTSYDRHKCFILLRELEEQGILIQITREAGIYFRLEGLNNAPTQ